MPRLQKPFFGTRVIRPKLMAMGGWAERPATAVIDAVFPRQCPRCGDGGPRPHSILGPTASETLFCIPCRTALEVERHVGICPRCAGTVAPYELSGVGCSECRERPGRIQGTVRVGRYRSAVGELIRSYKFHGREDLLPVLAGRLVEAVRATAWLSQIEAVVAVPAHWTRPLTRSVYPASSLASLVARHIDRPRLALLRRTRRTHQVGLDYAAREKNVKGAFAVRRGVTLRSARLLVIDDVKTTGATLRECAKVLRRAGAAEVYAAVVAHAEWSEGMAHYPDTL